MGTSRGSQESTRGEAAGGSLPFVLAAGAAVVAFVLTRAFLDWNEDHYQWRRIWLETSYIPLMPALLALVGLWRKSPFTALLIAVSAALTMAIVFADDYASPLGYDNRASLVVAVFVRTALQSFSLGLLLPLMAVVGWLWKSGPRL